MPTLAMIHTGPVVIKPINDLVRTLMPDLARLNLMDDGIVSTIEREGTVTDAVRSRLEHLGASAVAAGADAILVTCSSISELTAGVAQSSGLPVFKIDEAMAEEAVRMGERIGVVATLPTTLEPTCRQIESKAVELGRTIKIERRLCREAFERLSTGDEAGHDQIVQQAVEDLAKDHDVVVLAQVSMARLVPSLKNLRAPVLSSPELGVRWVRDALARRGLTEAA